MSLFSFRRSAEAVHTSSFRPTDERWFFGKAHLFEDRVEFSGWTWRGRQKRIIALENIAEVRWRSSVHKVDNFVLVLHDEEPFRFWIKGPGLWKFEIESRADNLVPPVARKKSAVTHAA